MRLKKNEKAFRNNLLKVAKIALGDAEFSFEKGTEFGRDLTFLKFIKKYDYDIDLSKGILFAYWYNEEDKKWKASPGGYRHADIFNSYSEFWTHKVTDGMDSYIGEYEGGLVWIFNDDAYDRKERIAGYEKIDYTENDRLRNEYIADLYKDVI